MADYLEFISQQWMLVTLLVALIFAYTWLEKSKGGKSISSHGATMLLNRDEAIIVDVREVAEFKAGHIVDAVNIPYNKISDRMVELVKFKEKTLILVDKMGTHAAAVGKSLRKEGYEVLRLDGGMSEWLNQKLPVVKS